MTFSQIQLWLARAHVLTLSLFLHVLLVLIGGTMVLFHPQAQLPDFLGGTFFTSERIDPGICTVPGDPPSLPTQESASVSTEKLFSESLALSSLQPNASAFVTPGSQVPLPVQNLGLNSDRWRHVLNSPATRIGGSATTFFGQRKPSVDALVGHFYDLKQTPDRQTTGMTNEEYQRVFRKFIAQGWDENVLSQYFRASAPLYATQIMIPDMNASEGPKAFAVEKEVLPSRWLVHYHGKISPPEDGTYHFVGAGDDVLVVRFNGKVVLDRCWHSQRDSSWKPLQTYNYVWGKFPGGFAKGDGISVSLGHSYDIEILIGEQPGGSAFFSLLMEQEGAHYQRDQRGNPILPVFRVAKLPVPELESGQSLPPHAQEGPVWRAEPLPVSE